jgi:isopentenyl phosphate kinase
MVVHGGTAFDHPNGNTYILDVNHAFDMTSDQEPSLLNPNQLRMNDIIVEDVPMVLYLQATVQPIQYTLKNMIYDYL